MPREITVDGLTVDDRNHPPGYAGLWLFSSPSGGRKTVDGPKQSVDSERSTVDDSKSTAGSPPSTGHRPLPTAYQLTERDMIRALATTSGLKPRTSPDPDFAKGVKVVETN